MTILTIFDQTIIQKSYTKFLGLFIDDKLTWKPHATKYVLSKISRIVGILGKLNSLLTSSSMKTIYYSLVYPHILYGVIFWKAVSKAEFNKIFVIQKKIVRIITRFNRFEHTESLFKQLNIFQLKDVEKLQLSKLFLMT